MTYSYTHISHYLTCPRRYRDRYVDPFLRQDPGAALFRAWSAHQDDRIEYSRHDTWELMLRQGIQLLERFVQEERVPIGQPRRNLQVKFTRPISENNDFVAYVDAIGQLERKLFDTCSDGTAVDVKAAAARKNLQFTTTIFVVARPMMLKKI